MARFRPLVIDFKHGMNDRDEPLSFRVRRGSFTLVQLFSGTFTQLILPLLSTTKKQNMH